MKHCGGCHRQFPDHLIQPLVTNRGTMFRCPLCALKERNRLHGLPAATPFHGEMAAGLWREAKDFVDKKGKVAQ